MLLRLALVTLAGLVAGVRGQCACSTLDNCVDQRAPQRATAELQCISQCQSDATVTASLGAAASGVGQCYSQQAPLKEASYVAQRQCLNQQNARNASSGGLAGLDGGRGGRGGGRGGRGGGRRGKREAPHRGGGGKDLVKADERLCASQNGCTRNYNVNRRTAEQSCRTQLEANPAFNKTANFLTFCNCLSAATAGVSGPVDCASLAMGSYGRYGGGYRAPADDDDDDFFDD